MLLIVSFVFFFRGTTDVLVSETRNFIIFLLLCVFYFEDLVFIVNMYTQIAQGKDRLEK